ncbi:SDR family oxidoreductase [Streptomyces sp. NPDC053541]|uniref:SDR family oxidoreductase n=1 Tax=Streptomyces sp. NPDC053541 TaxID=3365709 RepID=UPI0037D03339
MDLARDGIRVCSIHPGPISTPMTAGMDDSITAGQPIPRFGTPAEVARMAVFLAAEATYSTGSEFVVDGGATTGSTMLVPSEEQRTCRAARGRASGKPGPSCAARTSMPRRRRR